VSPPATASPFDGLAESGANLEQEDIATFKAHLQACWKPPAGLPDAKNLMVVLRVTLNPNGALAAEPTLLAASASQGRPGADANRRARLARMPALWISADAKYKEWKLLDLSFTPAA